VTKEQRQQLREAARVAVNGTIDRLPAGRTAWAADWKIQTSNSFRRIGTTHGDGDVLCGTKHPIDGHPDLHAAPGVLDYIVAAQPRVVLQLLDAVDSPPPPLTAEERALIVEVCHDLINRAMFQEAANHGEGGDEWSDADRRKEAAIRKLLGGSR
jgi:hypothetical protein